MELNCGMNLTFLAERKGIRGGTMPGQERRGAALGLCGKPLKKQAALRRNGAGGVSEGVQQ